MYCSTAHTRFVFRFAVFRLVDNPRFVFYPPLGVIVDSQ